MMEAVREAPLKMLVERCLGVIANLPKGNPGGWVGGGWVMLRLRLEASHAHAYMH
jgi:hypothetical protein